MKNAGHLCFCGKKAEHIVPLGDPKSNRVMMLWVCIECKKKRDKVSNEEDCLHSAVTEYFKRKRESDRQAYNSLMIYPEHEIPQNWEIKNAKKD